MIYGVTSKKNGCGRSTVSALISMLVKSSKTESSLALVDLSSKDLNQILNIQNPKKGIDDLISAVFLGHTSLNIDNSVTEAYGISLITGTSSKGTRYLEKRILELQVILDAISNKFNTVILDIDYDLMVSLQSLGVDIIPIHIMEQNFLNYSRYKQEMVEHRYDGFYIINKYLGYTFPSIDEFNSTFRKGSLFCIEYDSNIITSFNKQTISLKELKETKVFSGISAISEIIINNISVIPTQNVKKKNKFVSGFLLFLRLFSIKTMKPSELNSSNIEFLLKQGQGGTADVN